MQTKTLRFAGRTDKAFLPKQLEEKLHQYFDTEPFVDIFDDDIETIILYGEGYGLKIQKGGKYLPHQDFILFDVLIDGMWLTSESVTDIADKLRIKRVPILGIMTIPEIENLVKNQSSSILTVDGSPFEGVVCRSHPLVLNRRGNRIIFKLKVRDYEDLEK